MNTAPALATVGAHTTTRQTNVFTKIGWTDVTFNPWWGCVRVSPACRFCYADTTSRRYAEPGDESLWRRSGPRRMAGDKYWRTPLTTWKRVAEQLGRPLLCFCASMCDVFEDHPLIDLDTPRARLWELIEATAPYLRWQLLTKRPQNIARMVPWAPGAWPENVWLGVSVERQTYLDQRMPHALATGARVVFASFEPLLEHIDIARYAAPASGPRLGWAIVGGESGNRAKVRRMQPDHADALLAQCADLGVPAFFKQAGSRLAGELKLAGKGERLDQLPERWKVRRFPAEHEQDIARADAAAPADQPSPTLRPMPLAAACP